VPFLEDIPTKEGLTQDFEIRIDRNKPDENFITIASKTTDWRKLLQECLTEAEAPIVSIKKQEEEEIKLSSRLHRGVYPIFTFSFVSSSSWRFDLFFTRIPFFLAKPLEFLEYHPKRARV